MLPLMVVDLLFGGEIGLGSALQIFGISLHYV